MADRPILFSAPMVRALLAGTKTQTRRIVKPDGKYRLDTICPADGRPRCPYGQPGDRLWVRETWRERVPDQDGRTIDYRADHSTEDPCDVPWRPSIHMPRWASRLTLEITDMRVERLQDISEADAQAEGADIASPAGGLMCASYSLGYRAIWEDINGPGSWDANPWVWVVSFKRVM